MSGGTGGAGGSPNGLAGSDGPTSSGFEYQPGGLGGKNSATVTVGGTVYGQYGAGGNGGDSITKNASRGQNGAVIISWGTGAN